MGEAFSARRLSKAPASGSGSIAAQRGCVSVRLRRDAEIALYQGMRLSGTSVRPFNQLANEPTSPFAHVSGRVGKWAWRFPISDDEK